MFQTIALFLDDVQPRRDGTLASDGTNTAHGEENGYQTQKQPTDLKSHSCCRTTEQAALYGQWNAPEQHAQWHEWNDTRSATLPGKHLVTGQKLT